VDGQTLIKYAPTITEGLGVISTFAGQRAEASAAEESARRAQMVADFEARQLEQQSRAAFAKGTREASEERRKAAIVASGARAAGAASGAAFDEGMAENLAEIETEGDYNALMAMFNAQTIQQNLQLQAATRRWEGDVTAADYEAKAASAQRKSLSTILSGATKAYESYSSVKKPKTTKRLGVPRTVNPMYSGAA